MSSKKAFRALALLGMCLVFIWITAITIPLGSFVRTNPLVITTFVVNGVIWLALLISEINKRAFSFAMIHWSFCLLFFFYAAIIQYAYDSFPWVGYRSDEVLVKANLLLTLWTGCFFLGSAMGNRSMRKGKKEPFYLKEFRNYEKLIFLMVLISLGNMVFRIASAGFINLLARETSSVHYVSNSSIDMIVDKVFQANAYFAVILCAMKWIQRRRGLGMLALSSLALLISYFPTATARYVTAGIYLGVLLTYSRKMKMGRMFIFLFVGAFIVILPFLNAFRNHSFTSVSIFDALSSTLRNISTAWLAGDYDAYAMFTLIIDYVDLLGATMGQQLLGAMLFFVPRSIWPGKAVGSGYHVADSLGWSFKNLSCPLPGEGYINFGAAGVVLLALFIGRLIGRLDGAYWKGLDVRGKRVRSLDVIYPVTVIFFFFMSRGDLLSSFAYMVGYIAVWIMIVWMTRIMPGRKRS